jgi:tRNA pseudouridine38-40 synthase
MPRYKLLLEYDGGPFSGWQRAGEGLATVQLALEDAVEKFVGCYAEVIAAGRTDAGVHAFGQVAHVDLPKPFRADQVRDAINALVRPHPIAVLKADAVDETFHARFSAIERVYWYRIINRRADLALDRGRAWRMGAALDSDVMQEAALTLLGHHDFTTFRDAQCQAPSPVKTLDRLTVARAGEEIHIHCAARSFLHRQVRSIVGTLMEVGLGKWRPADVAAALAAKDRARCGPVAPADGLYLLRVNYNADVK